MVPNPGWKFYFKYFTNLDFIQEASEDGRIKGKSVFIGTPNIDDKKKEFTDIAFENYQSIIQKSLPKLGKHGFELITIYPGLLLGSGYHHEVGVNMSCHFYLTK